MNILLVSNFRTALLKVCRFYGDAFGNVFIALNTYKSLVVGNEISFEIRTCSSENRTTTSLLIQIKFHVLDHRTVVCT